MESTYLQKPSRAVGVLLPREGQALRTGGMILAIGTTLVVLGVVMVFSVNGTLRSAPHGLLESPALRQIGYAAVGMVAMWVAYGLGYRWLRWRSAPTHAEAVDPQVRSTFFQPAALLLVITVLCLIAVFVPGLGAVRNGARRWLQFGAAGRSFGFQPSEMAKLAGVVFLAAWMAHRQALMSDFRRGILPCVAVIGVLAGLIVIEDLGTAVLLSTVGGMMILAAGARCSHALLMAVPGAGLFALMVWMEPYRVQRLVSYADIWRDPLASGYHAIQSMVTIANGGWEGTGLGAGTAKYGYLPQAQSDFIFSVVCEELGVAGGLVVVGLFIVLAVVGWRAMSASTDPFGKLLALGITALIGLQAAMNIGVATVALPTKGISLPLVSAGGSGVIFYSAAIGLLAAIDKPGVRGGPMLSTAPLIVFAGGGTGGHLLPGLAVADWLRDHRPDVHCEFLCTRRPIDAHILKDWHVPYAAQPVLPLRTNPLTWPRFYSQWRASMRMCRERFTRRRPALVLGTGGYGSAAPVRSAGATGIPTALFNPDAVPGRANRLLARRAALVMVQWPEAVRHFPAGTVVEVTGCPIRAACSLPRTAADYACFGLKPTHRTLLVTGASSGARTINDACRALAPDFAKLNGWQVLHIAGNADREPMAAAYAQAGVPASVVDFTQQMPEALRCADLALARAGAVSLAEFAASATPTVLMPYPYHADQHQRVNAEILAARGAAVIVTDRRNPIDNAAELRNRLLPLMYGNAELSAMSAAAVQLSRPDASAAVGRSMLRLAGL